MEPVLIAVILAAAAVALVALLRAGPLTERVTVWEWQRGLLFSDGRFVRDVPPGRYVSGLFGRAVVAVTTQPQQMLVPAQEVLTADGFPVKLGLVLDWQVADARQFHAASAGLAPHAQVPALQVAAQLALRACAASRTLDDLLLARAQAGMLEAEMLPPLLDVAATIGVIAHRVALRDLILPAEVRRMVTEVERARREGQAALERARGEQAALRSLANAARMMRGNPELQALRTLQALNPTNGRAAPTLVLGGAALMPVARGDAGPERAGDDNAEP